MAARGHASDEDALLGAVLHADAVAQQCAAREGGRGIDRDDGDASARPDESPPELIDQRRLAGSRRARDARDATAAGIAEDVAEHGGAAGITVLNPAHGP